MNATEPLAVTIQEAKRLSGWSTWRIYDELKRSRITARKQGRRTLINYASIKARLADLPAYQPTATAA